MSNEHFLFFGAIVAAALAALKVYGWPVGVAILVPLVIKLQVHRWSYILYKTLSRDLTALWRFGLVNYTLWKWEKERNTVAKIFGKIAKDKPNKIAFKFENTEWTFREVETFTNRIAHYFKAEGFRRGDTVALLMESKPEFICMWLGLSKIGVVTALINTNLRRDVLLHSLNAANSKALIFGAELQSTVNEVRDFLSKLKLYRHEEGKSDGKFIDGVTNLNVVLAQQSDAELVDDLKKGGPRDKLIYIYTSGTTGMPKAAVITNIRFMFLTIGVYYMIKLNPDDCMYDPLPLYHAAGGVMGAGQSLLKGVTLALKRKFSASNFWKDCCKYECTVVHYIGEMCRYVLAVPEQNEDTKHKVRLMWGNGFRPQIWTQFAERFGIKQICEGYGATEGNCNMRPANVEWYNGWIVYAIVEAFRYMFLVMGVYFMLKVRSNDCVYDPLPLYHSAGGIIGAGQCLLKGVTIVFRRKFSASNFWKDCCKYECTVAQYIGEICRYLLAVPKQDEDTKHKVRLMYGNGLRPQIWVPFAERFAVKQIGEFYGATEGNSSIININSTVGAVGFIPRYATIFYPVCLVKYDEKTGEPVRNFKGRCIRCKPNEPGVLIGKINPKKAVNEFSGYADKAASEKKKMLNVFSDGDCYFNSGDILVMDELGYFYFKDRTGDTFRWKGENVATSEVEAVISNVVKLKDAVVYGVEIPSSEGRAGMAAIVDQNHTLDMEKLAIGIKENLPPYARPLFVRVLEEVPLTGTYKLKKKDLQDEGYDITKITDKVYFLQRNVYVLFTEQMFSDIVSGKIRL